MGDSCAAVLDALLGELIADGNWPRHARRLRAQAARTGNTACIAAAEMIERRASEAGQAPALAA